MMFVYIISTLFTVLSVCRAFHSPRALDYHLKNRALPALRKSPAVIKQSTQSVDNLSTSFIALQKRGQKLNPLEKEVDHFKRHGFSENEWEKFLAFGKTWKAEAGTQLNTSNDQESKMYLVKEGKVLAEEGGMKALLVSQSHFVGETAMLKDLGNLPTQYRCLTDVELVEWNVVSLKEQLKNSPNIQTKILSYLSEEIAVKFQRVITALQDADPSLSLPPKVEVADYGYRNSFPPTGPLSQYSPASGPELAWWNFRREVTSMFRFLFKKDSSLNIVKLEDIGNAEAAKIKELRNKLSQLTLSNKYVEEKEKVRIAATNELLKSKEVSTLRLARQIRQAETSIIVLIPYWIACFFLDNAFGGRPISRFYFLEVVARMPYYSYISMLHLYETLGWWSIGTEVRKVHFAEEWNEMRHMKIMESLGADALWWDRFLARHAAVLYYWILLGLFLVSPQAAYNFMQLVEAHACDTYSQFLDENEQILKSLPPTQEAIDYYMSGDLYLFDDFQTSRAALSRRPVIESLYDVFANIAVDELEHIKTMTTCQISDDVIYSPNTLRLKEQK